MKPPESRSPEKPSEGVAAFEKQITLRLKAEEERAMNLLLAWAVLRTGQAFSLRELLSWLVDYAIAEGLTLPRVKTTGGGSLDDVAFRMTLPITPGLRAGLDELKARPRHVRDDDDWLEQNTIYKDVSSIRELIALVYERHERTIGRLLDVVS